MATSRSFRSNQPYSFTWFVPERGFEIAPAFERDLNSGQRAAKAGMFLIERNLVGLSKIVPYFPLREKTGLFKTFAALPVKKPERILEFANAYGPLDRGSDGSIGTTVIHKSGDNVHYAEPLAVWCGQIVLMKWLVRVWDAIRSEEQGFLKRLIRWEQNRVIAQSDASMPDCPWGKRMETIAAPDKDLRMWQKLRRGNLLDPATLYLQRNINSQLEEFPSRARLLWDNDDSFIFVEPTNLSAALWLQFALAFDGNHEYRVCEQCRDWFEIAGGQKRDVGVDHHRADARFCSNACKQKAYRRKGKK